MPDITLFMPRVKRIANLLPCLGLCLFVWGLAGCATTTADLVGGSTGLAVAGNLRGPGLLSPDQAHRVSASLTTGGGRFSGQAAKIHYDFKLAEDRDLRLAAGYVEAGNQAGTGFTLSTLCALGLVDNGEGFHWLTVTPEYSFLLMDFTEGYSFITENGSQTMFNAFLNLLGLDMGLGARLGPITLDVHSGLYAGYYAYHATQDDQIFYLAWKTGARAGLVLDRFDAGLSLQTFFGDVEKQGAFFDAFMAVSLGYAF